MLKINKQKFDDLLIKEQLSIGRFAESLCISRTQAWRVLTGKCSPGTEFITKFKQAYPESTFEEYFFIDGVA